MERINLDIEESAILDAFEADILQTSQNAVQEMDIARAAARIVPKGWTAATISDLAAIIMGQSPSSDTYNDQKIGLPFFQGKAEFTELHPTIKKWCSSPKKVALPEDILLSVRAPVGAVNIANVKCCIGRGLAAIRYKQCNKFLYYFFKHIEKQLDEKGTGSTFRAVSGDVVKNYPILTPPLNEQKRIVAKIEELFSELDNGITALKTAREQLKVYRQAVLKHAFEGKLTAQWRKDNADKLESPEQLLARIQNERETRYQQQLDEWKQAVKHWQTNGQQGKKPTRPAKPVTIKSVVIEGLVGFPNSWIWVEYAGICEQVRNGISAKPAGDLGTKIFRISAVRAMDFNLNDVRYLDNNDGQYDDYLLKKGDLVFTRYNGTRDYVGVCAEYRGDGSHLFPDKLIQTRLGVSSINPSYLEKAINCGISRKFMEARIRTTAGQSGISGGDVKALPVPVCSPAEQLIINEHIAERLSHIFAINEEIESSLRKAETLRQSILKKAFSGQLVPQDPNDEPASELLARIQAEKAPAQRAKNQSQRKTYS